MIIVAGTFGFCLQMLLFHTFAMYPAPGMHVEWVDDEAVVLNSETNMLHYLNPPAAFLYALILEHGYDRAIVRARSLPSESDVEVELPDLVKMLVDAGLLIDE